MSGDIFDLFNKRFRKIFKNWATFDEDIFEDIEENFEMKIGKDLEKSRSYSMSYKYETGMDKPEIKIEGTPTNEEVEKFIGSVQKGFGKHFIDLSDEWKKLKLPEKLTINDPSIEIEKSDDKTEFTFDMPGLGKDDISFVNNEGIITINGNNGKLEYSKNLKVDFEPGEIDIIANNGIITVIVHKKTDDQ